MGKIYLKRIYPATLLPDILAVDSDLLGEYGWVISVQEENELTTEVIYSRNDTDMVTTALTLTEPLKQFPRVHRFTKGESLTLALFVTGMLSIFFTGLGSPLLLGISAAIGIITTIIATVIDRMGVLSLRGQIPIDSISDNQQTIMTITWIFGWPLLLPYYSGRVVWQFLLKRHVVSMAHTNYLEYLLGINTMSNGPCPHCYMLIPLGADVCMYCATPLYMQEQIAISSKQIPQIQRAKSRVQPRRTTSKSTEPA